MYYQHDYFTANAHDLTPLVVAPFDTPTKRYSGFIQDQWRITPALTVNVGVRYDTETLYNGCAGPEPENCRPAAPTAAPSTRRRSRSPTSGRRASA